MRTIRIFISSPGDVAEEREKARQVARELQRRYLGRLELIPVLWEDLPLQADASFQQGIDLVLSQEHGIDIAVFILWSRLGSPLGKRVRKPDGSEYRSGTEREFDLMLQARQQSGGKRPAILAYVRQDDRGFKDALKDKPTNELEAMIQQRKAAEAFIREQFHEAEGGHNARAYHTFTEPVSFAVRLRTHLAQLLDELLPELALGLSQVRWEGSPFRGLQVFEFEHADIFFGRDQAVADVQLRLREQAAQGCAFVLIVGASGSGKSSLARAGVLPALTNHHPDASVKAWRRAVLVPGQHAGDLCVGLARALLEALPELREDEGSLGKLAEALRKEPKLAYDLRIEGVLKRMGGRLVLLVDQLEEVFTHGAIQPEDLGRLFAALDALARSGNVWVIATVRSDFYARCQAWPVLLAMKEPRGQHDLLPPTSAELRRIITEPVWLAGLRYERNEAGETLDQRILDDAVKHPEALPLLEYLLSELYERRTPEGVLTWKANTDLGGVEGALGQRAEEVFRRSTVEAQNALGEVLHGLVTVSEEDENAVVRQRARLEELTETSGKKALVEALLQARLLVADKDEAGQAVVHVAHEALLRRWERVVRWAEENREFLRVRARVVARMKEGSWLLEGDPLLEAARNQLGNKHGSFTEEQAGFVEDCVRIAKKARWRTMWFCAGLVALLGIFLCAFDYFWCRSYDGLIEHTASTTATNVVVVQVEAKTLQKLGENRDGELDRRFYAVLLERLRQDGASLVVFNVSLSRASGGDQGDALLASALRHYGRAVLLTDAKLGENYGYGHEEDGLVEEYDRPGIPGIETWRVTAPARLFETNAFECGLSATLRPDSDGVLRRVMSGGRFERHDVVFLAAQLAGVSQETLISYTRGRLWLRSYRPKYPNGPAVETVSLHTVISNGVPAGFFRNKAVFVGSGPRSGPWGYDPRVALCKTAFSSLPAVQLHATQVANLIRGEYLIQSGTILTLASLLAHGTIAVFLLFRSPRGLPVLVLLFGMLGSAVAYVFIPPLSHTVFPWVIVVAVQWPLAFVLALTKSWSKPAPASRRPCWRRRSPLVRPSERPFKTSGGDRRSDEG